MIVEDDFAGVAMILTFSVQVHIDFMSLASFIAVVFFLTFSTVSTRTFSSEDLFPFFFPEVLSSITVGREAYLPQMCVTANRFMRWARYSGFGTRRHMWY